MHRDKLVGQLESAAGLFTSMSKPWDQQRDDAPAAEPQPEESSATHRSVLSAAMSLLASWVVAIKLMLPDGLA